MGSFFQAFLMGEISLCHSSWISVTQAIVWTRSGGVGHAVATEASLSEAQTSASDERADALTCS